MTPTPTAWSPSMCARHPQSASNMIGKLEADVARLTEQRDMMRESADSWRGRASVAEAKLARVTKWYEESKAIIRGRAIDEIADALDVPA